MKKFIKTISALLVATSMTVPVLAAPADNTERFNDVTENYEWAKSYINAMADKGLISGYEDGTFRPDNDVTRLEALSLFARAMGSNDAVNEKVVEIAHDRYDAIIKNYNLSWGTSEIAYLMYKGALKKTDLDTYLKDDEKNTPMARYEAAIIITKAMGGEETALADLGVVLDYTDAREVPSNSIQYVSYATDAGIMEGMGDGTFSPNTPVKRSQMAVMLSRTVDKTNYSFRKMKLVDIETTSRTVTAKSAEGETEKFIYSEATKVKSMGDEMQITDVETGVDAVFTFSGENLVAIDTLSSQPDATVTGKYQNYASTSSKMTVKVIPEGETTAKGYECAEDVVITFDGSPATIRSFSKGDTVTLEVVDGKVEKISGRTKQTTITGAIVEEIDASNDVTLTISHGNDEYNGKSFVVSSDVIVKKNDKTVDLDSIYKGDKVTLTLEYDLITKITATSNKKVVEGTVKGYYISAQSTMTVNVNGEDITYQIPSDVEILVNGEEGSLNDFNVGDIVKITTESDAITKIVATSTQESSGHVIGVVTAVNASYGVITIQPENSANTIQVHAKDATAKFVTADGVQKKMANVEVGQTVDVRGTVSNGVFAAKLVVIVADAVK